MNYSRFRLNSTSRKAMHTFLLTFSLCISCISVSLCQELAPDTQKLNDLITEFGDAINQKDSIKFNKLFFTDKVSFTGIMSPISEMTIKKDYPEFQGIAVSTSSKFIRDICKAKTEQVERFYNIDLSSDGVIASISFDYSFSSGERMIQWGAEKWNVVFVDKTWLITDVTYSIRFPDVEEFPHAKAAKE